MKDREESARKESNEQRRAGWGLGLLHAQGGGKAKEKKQRERRAMNSEEQACGAICCMPMGKRIAAEASPACWQACAHRACTPGLLCRRPCKFTPPSGTRWAWGPSARPWRTSASR